MSALKLVISLWFIVISLVITTPAIAQNVSSPSAEQNYQLQYYAKSSDNLFIGVMHTLGCIAFGSSIVNQPCLTPLQSSDSKVQSNGGLLGFVTNTIVILYTNPPLHTANYLADIKNNLIPNKPAYAQVGGSGQGVIEPIKTLWEVSRNFAYIVMIIIFVVIGLMIMFRAKINPQTVISVQAALPGLVIGLILITLSYFLAALLVDVAFISTWVVGYYFALTQPGGVNVAGNILANQNFLQIFADFMGMANQNTLDANITPIANQITNSPANEAFRMVIGFLFSQISSTAAVILPGGLARFGGVAGPAVAAFNPAFALSIIMWFLVALILLYSLIQLVLKLVNNYIMILFLTITAPFTFLFASLPGRQGLAVDWARNMLCNVLAFPAVFAAFYFAAYLIWPTLQTSFNIQQGLNLAAGGQSLPLMQGLQDDFIRFLLAFGVIVASPTIPTIICNAIGKAGKAGEIFGAGVEGGIKGGKGYTEIVQKGGAGIASTFKK